MNKKNIYEDDDLVVPEEEIVKPKIKNKSSLTTTKKKPKVTTKQKVVVPTVVDHSKKVNEFFSSIKPKPEYVKHLVECRCILATYANQSNPPNHKFVVFSELDENANVKEHYAQCNNCGIIHRVVEVGTSYTIKKETMMSLQTIDDIKTSLPQWLTAIIEKHQSTELHIWQEAKFIYDNEMWGRFIVLAKEKDRDITNGKILQILGKDLHKIEFFERDDGDAKR